MIFEAIKSNKDKIKGASRAAIAEYIKSTYNLPGGAAFNSHLRKSLKNGIKCGILINGSSNQRYKIIVSEKCKKGKKSKKKKKKFCQCDMLTAANEAGTRNSSKCTLVITNSISVVPDGISPSQYFPHHGLLMFDGKISSFDAINLRLELGLDACYNGFYVARRYLRYGKVLFEGPCWDLIRHLLNEYPSLMNHCYGANGDEPFVGVFNRTTIERVVLGYIHREYDGDELFPDVVGKMIEHFTI